MTGQRLRTPQSERRCAICLQGPVDGSGDWACHSDLDVTPVHRGKCWKKYQAQKYVAVPSAAKDAVDELVSAQVKFGPFASTHEGYAVILEELDELWGEIKRNGSRERMRAEAIQVAAMAMRFVEDLCKESTRG